MPLHDALIFRPDDVDLSRSPLRRGLGEPTYVMGAFNPGLTRLANGNLLLMVRVAEGLREPVADGAVRAIRWTEGGYVLDPYRLEDVDRTDPRFFVVKGRAYTVIALTSLSWLLPVELNADGTRAVAVHYDRAIAPAASYQDLGVEDPRISRVDGRWYMTTCTVSAERLSTSLYTSDDALDWRLEGMVLDHQNKDMLLFEGKVGGRFAALTRPLGDGYLAYPESSPWIGGPAIHLATSPDALHWRPWPQPGLRARRDSTSAMKIGGGTPPIATDAGWLTLYHGVEQHGPVGVYRAFWALLDRDDPGVILRQEDRTPLLEGDPALTASIADQLYITSPVVFPTGLVDGGDRYIVASGEADLACRITHFDKADFA